ncbi:MAG: Hsp70 family protein, partial [Clostridiales bacterium]|nr:Hsp70 family protein [Clostridiales bacterium]
LTYPYSADDRYKIELKRLLEKAGVAVTKMIPEPTSAALYARVINKNVKINQPALLVDIGESRISTAELIYLEKAIDITKYHPVVNIGGKDYDATVSAYLTAESRKQEEMTSYQKFILNQRIKTAKAALPIFKTVKVDYESDSTVQIPIDLPRFRELVRPVTAKICESVLKSLKTNAKIKYIILSGGCIQTAFLQQSIWDAVKAYRNDVAIITLETGLENTPDIFDIELDGSAFAVAAGAALYSTGKYKINAVCPRSYGICSLKNYQSDKREWMVVLIKKNSPLPAKFTQRFQTVAPTAAVNIHVLSSQMETDTLIGNDTQSILNGKLVFKQRVEANYPVEITINVDEDGIGTATAAADNGRNGKFVSSSFSLDATT